MGTVIQDLRFAFRQLAKSPSFAIATVLTLALGIGANTAVFSLVNSLLLKPLPVPHAEQIATLAPRIGHGPLGQPFSWNEYKEIRKESSNVFSDVFAWTLNIDGLAAPGQRPDRLMTMFVSGNFFDALQLKPAAGRLFLSSEGEVLGQDAVVVLSYDYWKQKFNGDPGVVGRGVTIDGHAFTVVGVAPQGFTGMQSFLSVAAYMPISELGISGTPDSVLQDWQSRLLLVTGRLRPDQSMKQANATLKLVAQNLVRMQPVAEKQMGIEAYPEPQLRINAGDPNMMYIISGLFLALAVMVLMLACVNVGNLVLVRASARERELAIRTALGARRSRLLRQLVTESVLLAVMGCALGVVLGMSASGALSHIDLHADLPVRFVFQFDWRIFSYSFVIALLAGVAVGVAPGIRMAKSNINAVLHEGSRGVARGRTWFRDGLVVLQIAGSLVLLVVATLFVRSLSAMQTMDFGFKPDHVLNFVIDSNEIGMSDAETRNFAATLTDRLRQLPGIDAVAHASTVPFSYLGGAGDQLTIDGSAPPANPSDWSSNFNVISPQYFDVMGISLVRGRMFTDADNENAKLVAIVSESTAKKFWPKQDPIGRTFRMGLQKDREVEVVGVARDVEFTLFGGGKTATFFYVPYLQLSKGFTLMTFQLKSNHDLPSMIPTVEKTVHDLAPQLPVFEVQTMREGLYTMNGLLLFQIGATIATIMGLLGLTLAVIGLYGVVSYAVSCRVREIGLRVALGATRSSVFRMIYRQSVIIIACGLVGGLAVALLVARAVGSFVVVSVWDPVTYVGVALVLALAALGSCYPPAQHAMAIDPITALRED
ncbi:MAG TPA: ABC transporter permease [Terracidiphilus sp.]|nr:ABC transporter permease [Terracidiphilus sp.]